MSKEETTKVGAASTFRPIGAEGDRTLNLSIANTGVYLLSCADAARLPLPQAALSISSLGRPPTVTPEPTGSVRNTMHTWVDWMLRITTEALGSAVGLSSGLPLV